MTGAAFFQKDPQTLVAHPDQGIATLADVKGRPPIIDDALLRGSRMLIKALERAFASIKSGCAPYFLSVFPAKQQRCRLCEMFPLEGGNLLHQTPESKEYFQ